MRKTILFLCLAIPATYTAAQDEIPQPVTATFEEMYALTTETPSWEFREGAYVANLQAEEGLIKVFFHPYGEWLETRVRMPLSRLPKGVRNFVDNHYQTAEVTYAGKVIRNNEIIYRVESELPTAVVIKLLSEEGELLNERRIDFGAAPSIFQELKPLPKPPARLLTGKDVY